MLSELNVVLNFMIMTWWGLIRNLRTQTFTFGSESDSIIPPWTSCRRRKRFFLPHKLNLRVWSEASVSQVRVQYEIERHYGRYYGRITAAVAPYSTSKLVSIKTADLSWREREKNLLFKWREKNSKISLMKLVFIEGESSPEAYFINF